MNLVIAGIKLVVYLTLKKVRVALATGWNYCYFVIVLPLSMGGRNSSKDIRATANINDVAAPSQNVNAVAFHIGSVAASLEACTNFRAVYISVGVPPGVVKESEER